MRTDGVWSESGFGMMKDGSCAIGAREPCQVGDQAALSGVVDVPQGCLSGVSEPYLRIYHLFDYAVYGLI